MYYTSGFEQKISLTPLTLNRHPNTATYVIYQGVFTDYSYGCIQTMENENSDSNNDGNVTIRPPTARSIGGGPKKTEPKQKSNEDRLRKLIRHYKRNYPYFTSYSIRKLEFNMVANNKKLQSKLSTLKGLINSNRGIFVFAALLLLVLIEQLNGPVPFWSVWVFSFIIVIIASMKFSVVANLEAEDSDQSRVAGSVS